MFFPFSSFFFAEEFGWDAMTVPAKKNMGSVGACLQKQSLLRGQERRRV
jgi:hypothetical protein